MNIYVSFIVKSARSVIFLIKLLCMYACVCLCIGVCMYACIAFYGASLELIKLNTGICMYIEGGPKNKPSIKFWQANLSCQ